MKARWRRVSPVARGIDRALLRDTLAARLGGTPAAERIGITYPLQEERWRERRLATGMSSAFNAAGLPAILLATVRGELRPGLPDVTIALVTVPLRDLDSVRPDAFIVAWVMGTVEEWQPQVLMGADLVLAASRTLADDVAEVTQLRPDIAYPAAGPTDASDAGRARLVDVAFIGDAARDMDRVVNLMGGGLDRLRVYGPRWGAEPRTTALWGGDLLPARYGAAYEGAKTVLGLREPRRRSLDPTLLEAALFGALPLTQDVESATDMLGGLLPSFSLRSELEKELSLAGDESIRSARVAALADRIRTEHSYQRRASFVAATIRSERAKPLVAVKTCTPTAGVAEQWGDTHFARQFARALRRSGFRARVDLRSDWEGTSEPGDVVIHLRGLDAYAPRPGPLNLMWVISHPEDVTPAECERYAAVFTASEQHALMLREQVSVPVITMQQAADPYVFRFGERDPALRSDLLFVGNARWPKRPVPRWLHELEEPLTIYGARWEQYAESRYLAGTHVPNDALHRLYRSANIVVNDHWADMRDHGFISNRIFDALASGAFVISDHHAGISHVFGDAVPTFSSRSELRAILDTYRDDPVARTRHALAGRDIVLRHHTFDHRAARVTELIDELRPSLRHSPLG